MWRSAINIKLNNNNRARVRATIPMRTTAVREVRVVRLYHLSLSGSFSQFYLYSASHYFFTYFQSRFTQPRSVIVFSPNRGTKWLDVCLIYRRRVFPLFFFSSWPLIGPTIMLIPSSHGKRSGPLYSMWLLIVPSEVRFNCSSLRSLVSFIVRGSLISGWLPYCFYSCNFSQTFKDSSYACGGIG